MTTDSQPTPEQVVADHSFLDDQYACLCQIDSDVDTMDRQEHAAHVLATLRDAGYAVVKLPEPNADLEFESGMVSPRPGFNRVRLDVEDGRFTTQDAHDLGCELIAAARLSGCPDAADQARQYADKLAKARNVIEQISAMADSYATASHAVGDSDQRRRWLDVAIVIERGGL